MGNRIAAILVGIAIIFPLDRWWSAPWYVYMPLGVLALQLRFLKGSESMGNHDSNIVDACCVD
jgi:hypothetical protein